MAETTTNTNSITLQTTMAEALDEVIKAGCLTGWMVDQNAANVVYTGGSTFKLGKITAGDGNVKDYNRNTGFSSDAVTLTYETHTFEKDWGKEFFIDSQDVDETNYLANATNILNTYTRQTVIPAVDKYRIQTLAANAGTKTTVTITKANVYSELTKAINTVIGESGLEETDVVLHVSRKTYELLQNCNEVQAVRVIGGNAVSLNGNVKDLNGAQIIVMPNSRMKTADTTPKDIEFIAVAKTAPIVIEKHAAVRTFSPEQVQKGDGYLIQSRLYHTAYVPDNKKALVVVNIAADATNATNG